MFTEKQILKMLMSQEFADWYENEFQEYVTGELDVEEEDITEKIVDLIS